MPNTKYIKLCLDGLRDRLEAALKHSEELIDDKADPRQWASACGLLQGAVDGAIVVIKNLPWQESKQ